MELSEKMKKARSLYGTSAHRMAVILGFGVNQWRLYEEGATPNASNMMLILLSLNPDYFNNILFVLPDNIREEIGLKNYYALLKRVKDILTEVEVLTQMYRDSLVSDLIANKNEDCSESND